MVDDAESKAGLLSKLAGPALLAANAGAFIDDSGWGWVFDDD
jgi:hypothetical protein